MKTSNILLSAFLILIFVLLTWFIVNAKFYINASVIETSGNNVTESLKVAPFNKVRVQGKFQVQLSQGNEQLVEINTDQNIFPEVIAEVNGGELTLRLKSLIRDQDRVKVNLQMPEIQALGFSAGSNLSTIGEISGEHINIDSYAGSEGSISLNYNSLICDSKAGSSLTLSGTAENAEIKSTAGSRIDAKDLKTNICSVNGSAGSHVEIHVNYDLTANVSSGGSLMYYGDPEKTNFNASSGGSINKR